MLPVLQKILHSSIISGRVFSMFSSIMNRHPALCGLYHKRWDIDRSVISCRESGCTLTCVAHSVGPWLVSEYFFKDYY